MSVCIAITWKASTSVGISIVFVGIRIFVDKDICGDKNICGDKDQFTSSKVGEEKHLMRVLQL